MAGKTGKREVVTKVKGNGSPFRVGDVLLSINGECIDGHAALFNVLGAERIGHKTAVEVLRDGERTEFDIVPERLPD